MTSNPRVGSRVYITLPGDPKGTIRYLGPARLGPTGSVEVWIGLEMDSFASLEFPEVILGGDGMVHGMRYFSCSPGRAVFVKKHMIRGTGEEEEEKEERNVRAFAAVMVQCLGRRYIAKKRVRARLASHAWNVLDTHLEELGIQRGAAVARAQHNLQREQERIRMEHPAQSEEEVVERVMRLAEREVAELTLDSLATIRVAREYDGPHLRFPLNLDSVKAMMEDFKQDKVLHYRYLMSLFHKCKQLFSNESNVQEVSLDPNTTVMSTDEHGAVTAASVPVKERVTLTVVGDTHGQLEDLFTIFSIKGLPSPSNMYLFNGDFVDRGCKGVEILAVLCAFKILYPRAVFLNRGNHEARAQNAWMGFEEEILAKYTLEHTIVRNDRRAALRVHMLCEQMFDSLPICAVIHGRVFICHGGLFRNDGVTLNHLRSISRKREPPLAGRTFEDRVFEDILWSDPRPTPHYPRSLMGRRASDRGAGCEFGPAITQQFCTTNQISLVVRSHECVPEGFEVLHNGRLITIFSASRYCGTQTNKGAFITFGPELQPEVQQFYAETQAAVFITDEERQHALEEDAIHMIVEQIVDKKVDLFWYFTKNDVEHTGYVSRVDWASALTNVLALDLPFLHYQPYLADAELAEAGGIAMKINYSKFLSRFQIRGREEDSSWQDAIVARVCERLYALCAATSPEVASSATRKSSSLGSLSSRLPQAVNVEDAWRRFDSNTNGRIEFSEFVETLKSLDVGLTDQQMYELMRSVDTGSDAHIDFVEFSSRFGPALDRISSNKRSQAEADLEAEFGDLKVVNLPSSPLTPKTSRKALIWDALDIDVVETLSKLSRIIYRVEGSGGMPVAFAKFDLASQGFVEFFSFMEVLKGRYEFPNITDEMGKKMYEAIDSNHSGKFNYQDFLAAFQIADAKGEDWRRGVVQQVANVLYQLRVHARAAFRSFFDVDNDGRISAANFQAGMVAFNESMDSPLTLMQVEELRRALDKNGEGFISYREFFDGLSIVDDAAPMVSSGSFLAPDSPLSLEMKRPTLVRKSSSFYVQQLERDERMQKTIATKKAMNQTRQTRHLSSYSSRDDEGSSDSGDSAIVVSTIDAAIDLA